MPRPSVPYLDFTSQHEDLQPKFEAAFRDISTTGGFILGHYVDAFERDFASFCGSKYCIAVNSGTSALHLALLAAGVGPGDEVITTASTFIATVAAITYTGATPVLVDIDPETYCIDANQASAAVSPRTKAIIPVHLYGLVADMPSINAIAQQSGLIVIEDAAQAHGARLLGKTTGNLADFGAFSFYPGKNLGAFGEGGAITTNDSDKAELIRSLRDWGQSGKGNHVHPAYNYRMDAIQGAVLGIKLAKLQGWADERQGISARYTSEFLDLPLKLQTVDDSLRSVWHVYSLCHPDRDNLRANLQDKGIQTGIHYPQAVHQSSAYESIGLNKGSFPYAEKLAAEELSLPIFPGMTDSQIEAVISAVKEFVTQ
jgi:dTDP-4-amino-4,6-dideoxygalactose transaminase